MALKQIGTQNARHSKEQPNWETPQEHIELCRTALGGHIDLDVFSCATGNARVKADRFFTEADNGFSKMWDADAIFENHPGGTTKKAWKKTCDELALGHYKRLIWIGFSVEQLCILSEPTDLNDEERWLRGEFVPSDFSICFLRNRIHFIDPDDLTRPSRPGHANFILGIGTDPGLFAETFAPYGQTVHGSLSILGTVA